ncbi:MAG: nucleotidyltransferase domain-containing protein [Candidatus Nanoarchaeia archaeon]|nr:nucleotidyltransferase domain-containing protein [Candidatus Nanoarchaeia archaeon]
MASPSKEARILQLILENSPLKQWHFNELVKESKLTRAVANKWLNRYVKDGFLRRVKEKGKFPYFISGMDNPIYISRKKLMAIEQVFKSGLAEHLLSLKDAKSVILFGSFARGDWHKDSDIDIFIYGKSKGFDKSKYELKLKRQIELHLFENKAELNQVKSGMLKNVLNGYVLKGQMQDFLEAS